MEAGKDVQWSMDDYAKQRINSGLFESPYVEAAIVMIGATAGATVASWSYDAILRAVQSATLSTAICAGLSLAGIWLAIETRKLATNRVLTKQAWKLGHMHSLIDRISRAYEEDRVIAANLPSVERLFGRVEVAKRVMGEVESGKTVRARDVLTVADAIERFDEFEHEMAQWEANSREFEKGSNRSLRNPVAKMTTDEKEAELTKSLIRAEAIARQLSLDSESADLMEGYDRIRARCAETNEMVGDCVKARKEG